MKSRDTYPIPKRTFWTRYAVSGCVLMPLATLDLPALLVYFVVAS